MWPGRWWSEFVAEPLQRWVGSVATKAPEQLFELYQKQDGFLNTQFLNTYLSGQPGLLATLVTLALADILLLLIVLCIFVAHGFGLCRLRRHSSYDVSQRVLSRRTIHLGLVLFWVAFGGLWLVLGSLTLDFTTDNFGGHTTIAVAASGEVDQMNENSRMTSSDFEQWPSKPVQGAWNQPIPKDPTSEEERENQLLLRKFSDLRELGYEFKPLESDATNAAAMSAFLLVTVFYLVILATGAIGTLYGILRRVPHLYNPMERARESVRLGRTLSLVAFLLLGAAPLAHLLSTLALVYSHAHASICPFEQAMIQNRNIEAYTNENYANFDPIALTDFLRDLAVERAELNVVNCRASIRPIQGIWPCVLAIAWLSLPTALGLFLFAKSFIRADDVANASDYSPHVPPIWLSCQTVSGKMPETYASIAETMRLQWSPAQFPPSGNFVFNKRQFPGQEKSI